MADTSNSTCALRTNSDGRRVVVLYEIHRLNPHNLTVYICTIGEAGYNGNTTISELCTCKKVTANADWQEGTVRESVPCVSVLTVQSHRRGKCQNVVTEP